MPQRKAIVLINRSYYPLVGGTERQLQLLAEYLTAKKNTVWILTRRVDGCAKSETIGGVHIFRLWSLWIPVISWVSFALSVCRFLVPRRKNIRLIGSFMFNLVTFSAVAGSRICSVPIFTRFSSSGRGGNLDVLDRSWLGHWKTRCLLHHNDCLITLNSETVQELRDRGVQEGKIRVIHNGIDTNYFKPSTISERATLRSQYGLEMGYVGVLFVGRLDPAKNLENLIRIWPKVLQRAPRATLFLVGDGVLRPALEAVATQLSVLSCIRFIGGVPFPLRFYQACDIFVFPSRFEGLSNALLEAMSCGLPVLASDIAGNKEVLAHRQNGILVNVHRPEEWVDGLFSLTEDALLRERLGESARQTVIERFSVQNMLQAYEKLFANLMTPSRGGLS